MKDDMNWPSLHKISVDVRSQEKCVKVSWNTVVEYKKWHLNSLEGERVKGLRYVGADSKKGSTITAPQP